MIRRLYKYLTEEKHGQRMMQGEILFRSLTSFQSYDKEDGRGDRREGDVRNDAKGKNLTRGEQFELQNHDLVSRVRADDIMVCCLSRTKRQGIAERLGTRFVVSIHDAQEFMRRIRENLPAEAELPEWPGRQGDGRRIGKAVIYAPSGKGINYAFPAEIVTRKSRAYDWQEEYRIMFGYNSSLKLNEVEYKVAPKSADFPKAGKGREPQVIRIGAMTDIATLHVLPATTG